MGDKLTEQEIQAIAAYRARGGVVTRCPDGAAIGSCAPHITVLSEWLAEHGLSVTPIERSGASLCEIFAERPRATNGSYLRLAEWRRNAKKAA